MHLEKISFTFLHLIGVLVFPCSASHGHKNAPITNILCNATGLITSMDLESNFSGAVYTQGHFFNPSCRYAVVPGTTNTSHAFFFPMNNCGTLIHESDGSISLSNTIVIQKHRNVQSLWDVFRNVSCRFAAQDTFELGGVFRNEKSANPFEHDKMESWMEFKVGSDISTAKTAHKLRIGDEFFLIVHLKDGGQNKDLRVSSCWAHDNEILEYSKYSTQLLDFYTCQPSEWISDFKSAKGIKNVSDKISYARLKAFKFPSTMILQITCSIQVCKNDCFTYCNVPKFSKNNHVIPLRKFKKRSVPASYSNKFIDKRLSLMKATIKALGDTLLQNRKHRSRAENGADFYKRISNLTSTNKLPDNDGGVTDMTSDKYDVDTTSVMDISTIGDGTQTTAGYTKDSGITTEYNSEPTYNNVYNFNLTMKIVVLSSGQFDNKHMLESSKLTSNCIPRLRFNLVTTLLSFILFCLILTCIALCLYLRKEKKKHLIDNFLLYNFY